MADLVLCNCNSVFESEVVACARSGADSLDAIGELCDAGTGCGSCRGAIQTILEEEAARRRRGEGLPPALLQLPLFQEGLVSIGKGNKGKKKPR
ncbi:MAG: (2Fe-2S)-binding protein [Myxococcales bacterium]|nr:(2Fe-2S)-binding protein [Myxococcales bacterium]MCB9566229.1 (2Fe-2S)-binding protein [Myxococcales bacterium]MCB9702713.1 (2Fe-2S)-binding protein [Myxococcales bacterium]